ncbi:MAG TPA: tRNA dihydrouridine(20/20a) synthase DusA [Xanthobacteraceae bacterium]|nr:tRNA dihydrouridine(20/20a) synthase DusA [Xanthobacteraceae bacterium]
MTGQSPARRFSVAPMMEWTDRHCRFFHRQLSRHALLYTEMITADAIIHGSRERLLGFDPAEHPVALQLGGSDPAKLATAARIGAEFGYDEINLNVGCPSDRVQEGRFGACLMREPKLVGDCVAAMTAAVARPVTVKCRLGVDEQDTEESLDRFADTIVAAGARALIVHARKAWLDGLSPRENRDVPPLDHARVYRLKQRRKDFPVIINGGIHTLEEAEQHLRHVDGVMLGRAAYQNPELLLAVDPKFFGTAAPVSGAREAVERLFPYIERTMAGGARLHDVTRHLLGLFRGKPGARAFRRHLATRAVQPDAGMAALREALAMVLDSPPELAETAAA